MKNNLNIKINYLWTRTVLRTYNIEANIKIIRVILPETITYTSLTQLRIKLCMINIVIAVLLVKMNSSIISSITDFPHTRHTHREGLTHQIDIIKASIKTFHCPVQRGI
jgi:hypothetical protein